MDVFIQKMFKYVTFCEILVSNEMDNNCPLYVLSRCILEVFGLRLEVFGLRLIQTCHRKKQTWMVFMFKYICPIISYFVSGTETHCVQGRLYGASYLVKLSQWVLLYPEDLFTSLDCHLKNKLGIMVMILNNLYYACFTLFGSEKVKSALLVDKRL